MAAATVRAAGRPSAPAVVWHALRPFSLTVAAVPALVGTAALAGAREIRPLTALGCLAVAVLLQAATNTLNDAEDAGTGADDTDTAMPSLAMRRGWVTPRQARLIGFGCLAVAGGLGIAVALLAGRPALLALGALGAGVGWAYTAPPLRLAYRPLGELASGLPMGIGIAWGTAAAQTDHVPAAVWWGAVPLVLLTAAILHANNARDRVHDMLVGKRTLATYLSPTGVVLEFRVLTGLVPAVIAAGLATRGLPWECLLALIPGALALRAAAASRPELSAGQWTGLLVRCVKLHLLTGLTLVAGLLLGAVG